MDGVFVRLPFLRIFLSYTVGVILSWQFGLVIPHITPIVWILASAIAVLFLINRKQRNLGVKLSNNLLGVGFLVLFFVLGVHQTHYKKLENQENHFSKYDASYYLAVVKEPIKSTERIFKTRLEVIGIKQADQWLSTQGKLLLYVNKSDTVAPTLQFGDTLLAKLDVVPIAPLKNEGEFDFKNFMALSGRFHQAYTYSLGDSKVLRMKSANGLEAKVYQAQRFIGNKVQQYIQNAQSKGIVTALLLGNKDLLDDDILSAYSKAGAMHVLAVSGLHVGIIFMVFTYLLKPLQRSAKGRIVLAILQILATWTFALIAGMGPSVRRAATMFTVMAIGNAVARKANIYNSILLSAFGIMWFDPLLLFHVGFQLSYAAVIGIIYFQPLFARLWPYPIFGLKWAWDLTCVSVAAQLSTVLLTVFYFHQFPVYFIFSNLIVIPAITVALKGSLLFVMASTMSDFFAHYTGLVLDYFLQLLNFIMLKIELLPMAIINYLWLDRVEMISVYALALAIILAIEFRSKMWLKAGLIIALGFGSRQVIASYNNSIANELVVYNTGKRYAVEIRAGNQGRLISNFEHNEDYNALSFSVYPRSWLRNGEIPPIQNIPNQTDSNSIQNQFFTVAQKVVWIPNGHLLTIENVAIDVAVITAAFDIKQLEQLSAANRIVISADAVPSVASRIASAYPDKVFSVTKSGGVSISF